MENITSEQQLKQMLEEGNITETEYSELLDAMKKAPVEHDNEISEVAENTCERKVPWQIWVVVGMLALEGFSNLLMIADQPMALIWLAAKCVFIAGLVKGWKWVFCLFVISAGIHVLVFLPLSPIVSLINLILIVLALWSRRFYFPEKAGPFPKSCTN